MGRDESGRVKPGIGTTETLRKWVRQDQIDAGTLPGATSEESAELRRTNEILKAAVSFSLPAPATEPVAICQPFFSAVSSGAGRDDRRALSR